MKINSPHTPQNSDMKNRRISAIKDAMKILSGKWKFHILGVLLEYGQMSFSDLQREIDSISPRMLSKELRHMEMLLLVDRTVLSTKPVKVLYSITKFGKTMEPILNELINWGVYYNRSAFLDR